MRIEAYNVMNIGIGFKMPAYRNISNCKNNNHLVVVGDGESGSATCSFAEGKVRIPLVNLTGVDNKTGEMICTARSACIYRQKI